MLGYATVITGDATIGFEVTNRKKGSLIIIKDAVPNSPTAAFHFTVAPEIEGTGSFTLNDDGLTVNEKIFALVPGEEYVISENELPLGWVLEDIVCELVEELPETPVTAAGELSWAKDLEARSLSITLGINQSAKCTFINKNDDPHLPDTGFPIGNQT